MTRPHEMDRRISDESALDSIERIMSGEVWSPSTLEDIADIVRMTGRAIEEPL